MKQCPFCNSTSITPVNRVFKQWMQCIACGAQGPVSQLSEAKAIELWDKRPEEDTLNEIIDRHDTSIPFTQLALLHDKAIDALRLDQETAIALELIGLWLRGIKENYDEPVSESAG